MISGQRLSYMSRVPAGFLSSLDSTLLLKVPGKLELQHKKHHELNLISRHQPLLQPPFVSLTIKPHPPHFFSIKKAPPILTLRVSAGGGFHCFSFWWLVSFGFFCLALTSPDHASCLMHHFFYCSSFFTSISFISCIPPGPH